MYLCGSSGEIFYPDPLILNGHPLPWVKISVHLGHQLSQECTTNFDCRIKRAQFIEKSTAIRELFKFANPPDIITVISLYSGSLYGSNLWDLYGERANQTWRCWNSAIKLAWNVPRETHTYITENLVL